MILSILQKKYSISQISPVVSIPPAVFYVWPCMMSPVDYPTYFLLVMFTDEVVNYSTQVATEKFIINAQIHILKR